MFMRVNVEAVSLQDWSCYDAGNNVRLGCCVLYILLVGLTSEKLFCFWTAIFGLCQWRRVIGACWGMLSVSAYQFISSSSGWYHVTTCLLRGSIKSCHTQRAY